MSQVVAEAPRVPAHYQSRRLWMGLAGCAAVMLAANRWRRTV